MINWKEVPILRILIPFLIGILLALQFDFDIPRINWFLFLFFFLSFFLARQSYLDLRRFLFGISIQVCLLVLGYTVTFQHNASKAERYFANQMQEEGILYGIIDDAPSIKSWVRAELNTQFFSSQSDSLVPCTGHLLIYLEKDSLSKELQYGDQIAIRGLPNGIKAPKNPLAFDFQAYMKNQNIYHQVFIKSNEWHLIKKKVGSPFYAKILGIRSQLITCLREHLPNDDNFSVGAALILGYKEEMTNEIRHAYANTGAMHVLAVSGLHVGLVAMLLLWLLNRMHIPHPYWKFFKVILLLIGIWAFAFITGLSASVMRASWMFSALIIGKEINRRASIYNSIAISAFILLLWNPYLIKDVGFQLSYLAVLGIIYFQPKIIKLWTFDNYFIDKAWQLVSVSLAAQITTLPISLYYFHQIPIYFWLSGLVVVPAASLILSLGLLLFISDITNDYLANFIGTVLDFVVNTVNRFIFLLDILPFNLIEGLWIGGTLVFLIYFVLFAGIISYQERNFRWLQISLVGLLFIAANYAFTSIKNASLKQVVVYDIYKHSLIDFMGYGRRYSIYSDSLEERKINYVSENYRLSLGAKAIKEWTFSRKELYESKGIRYLPNAIMFYGNYFIVIDKPIIKEIIRQIKVDYLIIRDNPELDMNNLLAHFEVGQIIFDNSNSKNKVEKWISTCKAVQQNYYNVGQEGAWILDIQ